MTIVIVLVALAALGLVLGAITGWLAYRARQDGATERLRKAIAELEQTIGAELLPPVQRLADEIDAWLRRSDGQSTTELLLMLIVIPLAILLALFVLKAVTP